MSNTNISDAIHLPKLYWLVEGEGQAKELAVAYAPEDANDEDQPPKGRA